MRRGHLPTVLSGSAQPSLTARSGRFLAGSSRRVRRVRTPDNQQLTCPFTKRARCLERRPELAAADAHDAREGDCLDTRRPWTTGDNPDLADELAWWKVGELPVVGVNDDCAVEDQVEVVARVALDEQHSARSYVEHFGLAAETPECPGGFSAQQRAGAQCVERAGHGRIPVVLAVVTSGVIGTSAVGAGAVRPPRSR